MKIILLIAALGFWAGTTNAQTVQGADDFEFDMAVMLWLDGVDMEGLPILVELAESGSQSAMVLLGLIEKMPETHSPWVTSLRKEERTAMFRQAGPGNSWMFAAVGQALADNWIKLWAGKADVETALGFARMGETRAARLTLYDIAARGGSGFSTVIDDPDYPAEMRYLAWLETGYTRADLRNLHKGDPQRAILTGQQPAKAKFERWLLSTEIAAPIAEFCNRQCPGSEGSCARAAYSAIGGYEGLILHGSPSASIISEVNYARSVTGMAALLRRPELLLKGDRDPNLTALARIDMCFAQRARTEVSHF